MTGLVDRELNGEVGRYATSMVAINKENTTNTPFYTSLAKFKRLM
jgi:hypothetical protein